MNLKLLPNNAMTFAENQHGNAVLEKLWQQREMTRCCDIVLYVDDKPYHAHRCILSACSPFFDSLLKASRTIKEQLTISSDSSEVFHHVLAYMYTGTVVIDTKNVSEMLKLANKLLLVKLKEYCAEYLERYMDSSNCLTVMEMASKFNLESLQKTATAHVSNYMSQIIQGEEILEFSKARIENFIKDPKWVISNEERLALITSWVYENHGEREEHLRSLLTWISWKDIHPQVVIDTIKEHSLFSCPCICLSFILDVLDENRLLNEPIYETLSEGRTKVNQIVVTDEDSDKFFNLAITTAIGETLMNEANVDKILTDKDLMLRGDLVSQEIRKLELEQYRLNLRDSNQGKSINIESHQNSYFQVDKYAPTKNIYGDSVSNPLQINYSQDFNVGIEELCKYTSEAMIQRQAQKVAEQGPSEENDLLTCKIEASQFRVRPECRDTFKMDHPSCYHYRDYREDNFQMHNGDKCPNMTNKISYINHKYYANNQLPSLNEFNCSKNSLNVGNYSSNCQPQSLESYFDIKDPSKIMSSYVSNEELNTDISCYTGPSYPSPENYYASNSYNDEPEMHSSSQNNYYKKTSLMPAIPSSPISDVESSLCDSALTINEHSCFPELKHNATIISPSKHVSCYVDPCTDFSVSNSPQDMSLPHLKLARNESDINFENHKVKYEYLPLETENPTENVRLEHAASPKCVHQEHDEKAFYESDGSIHMKVLKLNTIHNNLKDILKENELEHHFQNDVDEGITCDVPSSLSSTCNNREGSVNEKKSNLQAEICRENLAPKRCLRSRVLKKNMKKGLADIKKQHKQESVLNKEKLKQSIEKNSMKRVSEGGKSKKVSKKNLKESQNVKDKEKLDNGSPSDMKNCDVCDTAFNRKKEYFIHMKTHFPGPPHRCDVGLCRSSFKRIYHLLDHRLVHSEDKPFKCPNCPFTSRKMFNLKEHMSLHNKERPFKCDECGDSFVRKQHLEIHRTKHTDERPVTCETCGWSGKTRNSLLSHNKIHTRDLYSCQYPACAYTTPKISHLKEHMQFHSNSRPFACEICAQRFIAKSHLKRHLLKHESPDHCQCPHCDYSCARLDSLKLHIKRKHYTTKPRLQPRKRQLKKKDVIPSNVYSNNKDGFHSDKVNRHLISAEQFLFPEIVTNAVGLTLNSSLPPLPTSPRSPISNYAPPTPTPSTCTFETTDPDDPLMIVSEMEEDAQSLHSFNQASYLEPSIGQSFVCDDSYQQFALPFRQPLSYSHDQHSSCTSSSSSI